MTGRMQREGAKEGKEGEEREGERERYRACVEGGSIHRSVGRVVGGAKGREGKRREGKGVLQT